MQDISVLGERYLLAFGYWIVRYLYVDICYFILYLRMNGNGAVKIMSGAF